MLGSITPYVTQTSSATGNWSVTKRCLESYTDMLEMTRCRLPFPLVVCSTGKLLLFLILVCLVFTSSHQVTCISLQSKETHVLKVPGTRLQRAGMPDPAKTAYGNKLCDKNDV